jgi:hypothetical protein
MRAAALALGGLIFAAGLALAVFFASEAALGTDTSPLEPSPAIQTERATTTDGETTTTDDRTTTTAPARTTAPTATATVPSATTVEDDHGGNRGRGRGRGRGSGDGGGSSGSSGSGSGDD